MHESGGARRRQRRAARVSRRDAAARIVGYRAAAAPWVTREQPIDTPFVSVPGLLTAKCATNENASYLEVTVHGDPADPRVDDIAGDVDGHGRCRRTGACTSSTSTSRWATWSTS